ncbi:LytR C-terminal domain-containing protein [Haloechinothrix sp. LS1_15]|uniref:LytR C-terminal domain-containing protein n=1 Tax=Haloechinothrix sp. LS1_15 TaxID=2652248 RepID=UPI002944A926|nr:LytR C-terminal domain-containing protein [Haloechinothrix sp. LS1_15]MDV6014415.1 LytR family transcriptional regulator [Haloechinothrix sp. LS1_15]
MSFAGLSRPMRAAGFGLIGVAVIATAIGTATAISTDDPTDDTAVPTDPPEPEPDEPDPDEEETPETPPPEDETTPPREDDPEEPEDPETDVVPEDDVELPDGVELDRDARDTPVRVYNNSNISGLAARAASDVDDAGWNVTGYGNYGDGVIPTSTVYFREGTSEEGVAKAIALEFGMRAEPRFEGIRDSNPGVIIIVTRDYDESAKEY